MQTSLPASLPTLPLSDNTLLDYPASQSEALMPTADNLAFLTLVGERVDDWQIHRCQISYGLISQTEPMKLIYHYEKLDEMLKVQYPLQGMLLTQFDHPMTQTEFAHRLGLPMTKVARPWQLKFYGKLVIFLTQPEIALRLHWTNTLKPFEPVYQSDLMTAIEQSFFHWQFVDRVDVINKDATLILTADHPELSHPWQLVNNTNFVPIPAVLALSLQQFLHQQLIVTETWLPTMIAEAKAFAKQWQPD